MKHYPILLTAVLLLLALSGCSYLQPAPQRPVLVDPMVPEAEDPRLQTPAVSVVTMVPAEPTQSNAGGLDDEVLAQALAEAVQARDFAALRQMTGPQLAIATFNTQLLFLPPDEALDQLRQTALADGSAPAVQWDTDTTALLNGIDPLDLWGPVLHPVQAIHVTGLGADASEEGLLVIGRHDDGSFYWLGILLTQTGTFAGTPPDM
jgi:hypothetical protein